MIILNLMSIIVLNQSKFFPIHSLGKLNKGNARPAHPCPQYTINVNVKLRYKNEIGNKTVLMV